MEFNSNPAAEAFRLIGVLKQGGPNADESTVRQAELGSLSQAVNALAKQLAELQEQQEQSQAQIEERLRNLESQAGRREHAETQQPLEGEAQKQQDILASQHQNEVLQGEQFQLEPSVWESAILIGIAEIKNHASFFLLIAIVANIYIQLVLIAIVERSFPSSPIDLEVMEQWRRVVGHDFSQVDASGYSLVSKVCGDHPTLTVASRQQDILQSSRTYMDEYGGPALCVVAIIIHCMFWMKESERTLTFVEELWYLPVSTTTCISPSHGERLSLGSLPLTRKLFMYAVCLARLLRATALLWRGTLWLVYTISITDLLLNAVALEFIYNVDELVYRAFATRLARFMLERTRIQSNSVLHEQNALITGTLEFLRLFSLAAFTVVMFIGFLYPSVLNSTDVIESICGGNKDFAVAHHKDLDIFLYTSTIPSSADITTRDDAAANAMWKVADEIIAGKNVSSALKLRDIERMRAFLLLDASEVSNELLESCEDSSPSENQHLWQSLQQDLNISRISSCEDVSKGCVSPSSPLARMLCPGTCRCYYPQPSSALSTGCPMMCQTAATSGYSANVSCKDKTAQSLANNTYWASFWNSLSAFKTLEGSDAVRGIDFKNVVRYAMVSGCAVLSEYRLSEELCAEVSGRHALGTFCPEACKCSSNGNVGCPYKCLEQ